jgi:hypothetical protein
MTKDISLKIGVGLLVLVLFLLFYPIHIIVEAFVLYKCWNWLVPAVIGWPKITMGMAVVAGVIAQWFHPYQYHHDADWRTWIQIITKPLFLLLMAWVIKLILL